MTELLEVYGCTCDGCGEHWVNDDGIMAYPDEGYLIDNIITDGWRVTPDGKTYCPDCFKKLFIEDEETGEIKRREL